MRYLVGANRTLINHFADIGNMVVMKSQYVTSPDVVPGLIGNLLFSFDCNTNRSEFDTVKKYRKKLFYVLYFYCLIYRNLI